MTAASEKQETTVTTWLRFILTTEVRSTQRSSTQRHSKQTNNTLSAELSGIIRTQLSSMFGIQQGRLMNYVQHFSTSPMNLFISSHADSVLILELRSLLPSGSVGFDTEVSVHGFGLAENWKAQILSCAHVRRNSGKDQLISETQCTEQKNMILHWI